MSATITAEAAPRMKKSHIEKYAQVGGTPVRYIEGGLWNPGPPLILIHGYMAGADIWYPHTFPALAAHRHVIALDLPGFGKSGKLAEYSTSSYAHFVHEMLDMLGYDRVDLLGHSMGGQIAIAAAAMRPERVPRLVLVASTGLPATGSGIFTSVAALVDRGAYHFRLYPTMARLAFTARASNACIKMIQDDSIFGMLTDLTMPTLIIWGARDRITPLEQATILARTIPHARLYIMGGCGHVPFYQKHTQFEKLVLRFLSS
jgi:4,5:9,10-diseco-3-hydroxy-5,9,17-trioxoandrosta-1(10),2-diene-4-oate hydrolase